MQFNEETRLQDLADTYPWLIDAVAAKDERLKIAKTFAGKMLIKRSTIKDASRLSGFPVEKILEALNRLIAEHENS